VCVCVYVRACALTDFSYRRQHELVTKEPVYYYSAIRYPKKFITAIANSTTESMYL